MTLQHKLLGDHLTEDEFKTLPKEARVLWIARPTREGIQRAKIGMCIRVFLLAAATIYFAYRYGNGESFSLIFVLYGYEFAYYILRKEREEKDYREKRTSYIEEVEKFVLNRSCDSS